MTDVVRVALIAAVPPTVAALAALGVSIVNSRKADAIHVLVNSNLEKVKADLARAIDEIAALRKNNL